MGMTLNDVRHLLANCGSSQYGSESVSQLEHALQCAQLAEAGGETPETVAACLLHDLGHLLATEQNGSAKDHAYGDDLHQYLALPFLRGRMPDAVLEPIRLHVDAKRYLCQVEQGYLESLSPASVLSLTRQGGPFNSVEAQAFMMQAHANQAICLRRYDDLAKVPGRPTPGLDHYRPLLARWL